MATTRAKFRCNKVELMSSYNGEDGEPVIQPTVFLNPVHAPEDDGHENHKFWQASPMGEMRMTINNPAGAEVFEVGREYYLDFTPVPAS